MNSSIPVPDDSPQPLPDFTRLAWVNESVRLAWEPRIERIRRVWSDAEWQSVALNVRECALVAFPRTELDRFAARLAKHGLSAIDAPMPASTREGWLFALVGSLNAVHEAREAWIARSDERLGQLFGYPDCCRRFFRQVWADLGCKDTTWHMALNSATAKGDQVDLRGERNPLANILWRWIGVRAVPHLPCSFACEASITFGQRMLGVLDEFQAHAEADGIREILAWPAEWSALHGIAEIKTPLLRVTARTDPTGRKLVVRHHSSTYPAEGATGLRFPYHPPERTQLTEGRGFQIALHRPLAEAADEQWRYRENGFSSMEAMRTLHAPIVDFVQRILGEKGGRVLDLGCGNGALLGQINESCPNVEPFGIERNSLAVQHARQMFSRFYSNVTVGDLFDESLWVGGRHYAVTLLMPGRLLEIDKANAERLVERIEAHSDAVVLYAYPDQARGSLGALAAKVGLRLKAAEPTDSVALLEPSNRSRTGDIDWQRMAEPQDDQYDTEQITRLASSRGPRSPKLPAHTRACTLFDGKVIVAHVYEGLPEFAGFSPGYLDAPLTHPNIAAAVELIRTWPAAYEQCKQLLEAIHPAIDASIPFLSKEAYRGSSCHSFERYLGTLWSTIHCPYGLAEAIVHEMAHQKLRAMGVSFESATRIVGNNPSLRYVSPIVKDRLRPMSAVLHAQYSYVHVTALDIFMVQAESNVSRQAALKDVLRRNLVRIGEGATTLSAHFVPGSEGKEFMAGLEIWTRSVIRQGSALLATSRGDASGSTGGAEASDLAG